MTFFQKGVDNSKMILETILGKIKLYEKGQDKKWAELIQVKMFWICHWQFISSHRILATSTQTSAEVKVYEKSSCIATQAPPPPPWWAPYHPVITLFYHCTCSSSFTESPPVLFSGQVWLDDKKSQTVRVESIQVTDCPSWHQRFFRVRSFVASKNQSLGRLSTIVRSQNSYMASVTTRYQINPLKWKLQTAALEKWKQIIIVQGLRGLQAQSDPSEL